MKIELSKSFLKRKTNKIEKLLKDVYFWLTVAILSILIIFIYLLESHFLNLALSEVERHGIHLILLIVRSGLFLVVISITAWRFRIKGGLIACIIVGLILLPHIIGELESFYIPSTLAVYSIGTASGIIFSFLIGKRKQTEEALRKSQTSLAEAQRIASVGSFEWNIKEDESYLSDEYFRIFGFPPKKPGFSYDEFLSRIHPEDREYVKNENSKSLSGNKPHNMDFRIILPNGSERFIHSEAEVILNDSGEPVNEFGVIQDITNRKRLEAEKEKLQMEAQISNRLASIGEMASGIAHEINNPLTGVIGFSKMLMEEDVSEDIKSQLEVINSGAQRVANIVQGLLTFSRQSEPKRNYIDINAIIENTINLRAYSLKTNNIKVFLNLEPDLPWTIADDNQLQQVFLNLIINAEVEMKLAHGKGSLSINTERVNETIRISFKDNGPGISDEYIDRIFDPFFTTKKPGEGTGLGLSICHGIMVEHKGKIYAQSEEGKGAIFIVELPIITEENHNSSYKKEPEEARESISAKILVVDDEAGVRQYLGSLLTKEGYNIETVGNCEDALKMIENEEYKLILLDIKMPGMNGIELYQHIQQTFQSLAKKVIFMTGDVMGLDVHLFLKNSEVPYITKPFKTDALINKIKTFLNR